MQRWAAICIRPSLLLITVSIMAATSSALQNLALELIARICACCCPEDLRNLANTCRTMFYVSRALRWHRISVNEDQYFEFREWLLAEERRTPDGMSSTTVKPWLLTSAA